MIVKIKKYVAKVAEYKEREDGSISKEVQEIAIDGKRFTPASIYKRIPRNFAILEHGWKETAYEIGIDELEKFLSENGKPVAAVNAE